VKRRNRKWFWRFRDSGPPAYVEQSDDGRWRIIIGRREIAIVASWEVAIAVVDEFDAKAKGGGDGET
jgi:hypothetical protein